MSSPTSVASAAIGAPNNIKNVDGAPENNIHSTAVTPPKQQPKQQQQRKKKPATLSSLSSNKRSQHPEMNVPKIIIDELLLVCGVIGSTHIDETTGIEKFVPVTDALAWLQDMQRVLKRDHEIYRPISLKLGSWKVLGQKLLPLVMHCRFDKTMVMTAAKILVILTKPMSENAKKAGRMSVDVKSGKVDADIIQEQIILRENAIEQSDLLMEYKRLFVRHSSHHYAFQNQKPGGNNKKANNKRGTGLLSIFTSFLDEPLSKVGSSRTSSDHLIIELVLHLIRNLLSISPINTYGSPEKAQYASQLQHDLLVVLQEEMVLDVLVCVGQEIERRENTGYNLLMMEIISHLLRGMDPSEVALSSIKSPVPSVLSSATTLGSTKKKPGKPRVTVRTATRAKPVGSDSLKSLLQTDRQKVQLAAPSRHSHFGGTLSISKPDGKQSYVSASDYLKKAKSSSSNSGAKGNEKGTKGGVSQPTRRKNKKAEVFVGSKKSCAQHSGSSAAFIPGPASKRAYVALNSFCTKFISDCYGPVMKSLKNDFRRDSNRLEDGDRIMFFRIVWFFHQWWRVSQEQKKKKVITSEKKSTDKAVDGGESSAHTLIFTMDVFMFNLVLNSTDEFFEHKKPAALAQTAALYTEMIHMLHVMYDSKDTTERMMALGLMDRLFYANEPLDRLPKLLARWTPGLYSREFLCDLVECSHVIWRLLDTNAQRCLQSVTTDNEKKRPQDTTERFNMAASEFDTNHYFMRKFVSNQIVFMYTQLLSQYDVNAAHINRHIAAYFIRVCKFSIKNVTGEDEMGGDYDDALGKNELATKPATLEPMLYNIGLFTVLDKVLNDPTIRDRDDYAALLMFATSFMKRFAQAAEANPMLYVEALFKHPIPHRFCELTTNMYVNEELRMIAVRDLLLEDQRRYEQAEDVEEEVNKDAEERGNTTTGGDADKEAAPAYDDDSEEEVEFNEEDMDTDAIFAPSSKRRGKSRKGRKSKFQWETADTAEEEKNKASNNGNGDIDEENDAVDNEKDHLDNDSESDNDNNMSLDAAATVGNGEGNATNATLSGKKRIRKSLEGDESSDEEDFLGSSAPSSKATKRVILDDDDDDD